METLDVIEDIGSCFTGRAVRSTIDALSFESTEEAFDGCVVGAAPNSAHAADQAMTLQEPLILVARELRAAIRVQYHRRSIRSLPERHQNGLQHKLTILAVTH